MTGPVLSESDRVSIVLAPAGQGMDEETGIEREEFVVRVSSPSAAERVVGPVAKGLAVAWAHRLLGCSTAGAWGRLDGGRDERTVADGWREFGAPVYCLDNAAPQSQGSSWSGSGAGDDLVIDSVMIKHTLEDGRVVTVETRHSESYDADIFFKMLWAGDELQYPITITEREVATLVNGERRTARLVEASFGPWFAELDIGTDWIAVMGSGAPMRELSLRQFDEALLHEGPR